MRQDVSNRISPTFKTNLDRNPAVDILKNVECRLGYAYKKHSFSRHFPLGKFCVAGGRSFRLFVG